MLAAAAMAGNRAPGQRVFRARFGPAANRAAVHRLRRRDLAAAPPVVQPRDRIGAARRPRLAAPTPGQGRKAPRVRLAKENQAESCSPADSNCRTRASDFFWLPNGEFAIPKFIEEPRETACVFELGGFGVRT